MLPHNDVQPSRMHFGNINRSVHAVSVFSKDALLRCRVRVSAQCCLAFMGMYLIVGTLCARTSFSDGSWSTSSSSGESRLAAGKAYIIPLEKLPGRLRRALPPGREISPLLGGQPSFGSVAGARSDHRSS